MIKVVSVGIVSDHDIRFLKKQHELFKRFLKEDFEFVCGIGIGTHDQETLVQKINEEFSSTIQIVRTPQLLAANYCWRGSIVCQETVNNIHPSKLFIVHSDTIPVAPFSLEHWFNGYDIGGFKQIRPNYNLTYIWENMLYLDTTKVSKEEIDFSPVLGGDTTSAFCNILPKYKVRFFEDMDYPPTQKLTTCYTEGIAHSEPCVYLNDDSSFDDLPLDQKTISILKKVSTLKKQQIPFHSPELYMNCLYHYRSGSNWHRGGSENTHGISANKDTNRTSCHDALLDL